MSECSVWTLTTTCHLLDFSRTLYTLAHLEFENRTVPIKPDGAGSIPDRFAVNRFVRCRLCQQPSQSHSRYVSRAASRSSGSVPKVLLIMFDSAGVAI